MKVVCAPDSFKESLTAVAAAEAMGRGVERAGAGFTADRCPVADGGEGTLEVLVAAAGGEIRRAAVMGPLGQPIETRFGILADGKTGVVGLADASGLALIPPAERDPTQTTTFGTGELIRRAMEVGCSSVIVCIGGSSTCDGGAGLAQALGGRFFDRNDQLITEPMTGGLLASISRFQPPDHLPELRAACDVTNPLCGESGSAAVYGPQKGATPEQVQQLDRNLAHLAVIAGGNPNTPGYGAAGGAGYGLSVLCGATLTRGVELVLEAVKFDQRCQGADLVLTGEGRLDRQSLHGKAGMGVAAAARRLGIPTITIVGATGDGASACLVGSPQGELASFISLTERYGLDRSLRETAILLEETAQQIVTEFAVNRR